MCIVPSKLQPSPKPHWECRFSMLILLYKPVEHVQFSINFCFHEMLGIMLKLGLHMPCISILLIAILQRINYHIFLAELPFVFNLPLSGVVIRCASNATAWSTQVANLNLEHLLFCYNRIFENRI